MKRVIKYIAILLVAIILPGKVFAAGSITATPTSVTITKGGSAKVTVKANNAAGRLDISSSNTKIATVGTSSVFLDNQSQTIKITGNAVGSTTVVIKKTDVATYDGQVLTGNIVINVKVIEKTASKPTTTTAKPTTTTETKENPETKKSEAYEIALLGVKKVETSLLKSDFDTVKEMVNSLKSEEEKKELLDRLNLTESNLKEIKNELVECDVCEKCEKSSNTLWIIISVVLLLLLIAENVYLFLKNRNMYDYS